MTKSEIARKNASFPTALDNIFENFRRDMEDVHLCQSGHSWAQEIDLSQTLKPGFLYATWKIWAQNMKLL